MNKPIPVVILAGGSGKRIGGRKPWHRLSNQTLLDHAINKAGSYSPTVAVSIGTENCILPRQIPLLKDKDDIFGPIAGLEAAMAFGADIGARHVMIMPCDTPFLPDDLLHQLHDNIGKGMAALARYADRLHPACSLWHTGSVSLLPKYLLTGRRSLIGFAEMLGHATVTIPPGAIDPFFNINTVDDLARAEQILADIHAPKS